MQLRTARATSDDARDFTRLAQMAGDDLFTTLLGNRAAPALQALFRREDNDFSFRHTTLLVDGRAVAGMLHAYATGTAQDGRTTWLLLRYAGWQIPRLLAVGFLLSPIFDFMSKHHEERDFYISFLAVDPAYRGRGLSQTLLDHGGRLARERGCDRLTLDVDERNHIAIGAYRKARFEQVAESKRIRLGEERLAMLRLAKTLDG